MLILQLHQFGYDSVCDSNGDTYGYDGDKIFQQIGLMKF